MAMPAYNTQNQREKDENTVPLLVVVLLHHENPLLLNRWR
jgi:hypothetical protein